MDKPIGTTLLGYTILREIGEGGMGKVYLAENQMVGQQVAIKILDPVLARNPDLRERFAQEARIQVALQHQNIVRVLNAQSSEELSFLIMEYIEGQSLDKVLKRRGKLSVDESIKIFQQVLDAVGYAHAKGIIHRDLKPSNIMVCADGTTKVTDFGIAKVLGDTKLTRTGTSMGSPDYMSPEQVLGKKDIDHRTDIYSLGATLYEMLTGRPPFVIENGGTSDSEFLVKEAHVRRIPIAPSTLQRQLTKYVSIAVMKALEKEPAERFVSCEAFSKSLRSQETELMLPKERKRQLRIIQIKILTAVSAAATILITALLTLSSLSWPSKCPSGYIQVPASHIDGLGHSKASGEQKDWWLNTRKDFCVMKYPAKKGLLGKAESVPDGFSWQLIRGDDASSQDSAMRACSELGSEYRLMSNTQWMTIARNIEATAKNWSLGAVGRGVLVRGHSRQHSMLSPAFLEQSSDQQPYFGTGDSESSAWEQRRTFVLSNGEVIWDFAGNDWQIVSDDVSSLGLSELTEGTFDYTAEYFSNQAGAVNRLIAGPQLKDLDESRYTGHLKLIQRNHMQNRVNVIVRGGSNVCDCSGIYAAVNMLKTSSAAFRCAYLLENN